MENQDYGNNDDDIRINEIKIPKSNLNSINFLYDACKSTLKIITSSGIASGFFIELERKDNPFYCLMTNEHVLTNSMIESKEDIEIYYDNQHKKLKIKLDKQKPIKPLDKSLIPNFENSGLKFSPIAAFWST